MFSGGKSLRVLRERLGLTMRDVEHASVKIAESHRSTEFLIPPSRLSDIETKGIVPSIYRFYSLAAIYHQDIRELLSCFGVDLNEMARDVNLSVPAHSHFFENLGTTSINMPVRLVTGFDSRRTSDFSRMIEKWGAVPMSYLEHLVGHHYAYGYIGSEDMTMYPILQPGTFVQIDESKNEVAAGPWRSEYERPIYFVETREGHCCCWCALNREGILLQPHPLSPVAARLLKYPQAAEIIGQVVGIAMRLGDQQIVSDSQEMQDSDLIEDDTSRPKAS